MLFRFSLYGFLKNLRIYDAFLLIALLDRNLDFAAIGWLVAIREVSAVALEVPSGAVADTVGRKRCMVASMLGYVASALLLGLAESYWMLALGMSLYGVGDAFRSGTHKAMIYAWLRQQGRIAERTRVYGFTRSWSKMGSACSALVGGAVLMAGVGYRAMFLASAIVALMNAVNLATYPNDLDERVPVAETSTEGTIKRLLSALRQVVRQSDLRAVVTASAVVQGGYDAAKDYVQPVVQAAILSMPVLLSLGDEQKVGLVLGPLSAVLFVVAGIASRKAYTFERWIGGPDRSARAIAILFVFAYLTMGACLAMGWPWAAALTFVGLATLQNLWRPVQVSRFHGRADANATATVLSVESQASALFTAAVAPLLGACIDWLADGEGAAPLYTLTPVALVALPIPLLLLLQPARSETEAATSGELDSASEPTVPAAPRPRSDHSKRP